MLVQNGVAAIEILFLSRLGTDALAGISAVSPLATLFIGITTVGMGGAVSSAVAQSLGAGKSSEADALAVHAILLALIFGAISAAILIGLERQIYGALEWWPICNPSDAPFISGLFGLRLQWHHFYRILKVASLSSSPSVALLSITAFVATVWR